MTAPVDARKAGTLKRMSHDDSCSPSMTASKKQHLIFPRPNLATITDTSNQHDAATVSLSSILKYAFLPSQSANRPLKRRSGVHNSVQMFEHAPPNTPYTKSLSESGLQNDLSYSESSSMTSPSSTLSPLLSHSSFSTMISSLCNVPENTDVPPCALKDDNHLFFDCTPEAVQTVADSPKATEILTCLESIDSLTGFPTAHNPALHQIGSSNTPADAMSAVASDEEACQPLIMGSILNLSNGSYATVNKQSAATFTDLTDDILRKIFEIVLVEQRKFCPHYRCGMLTEGPWSSVDVGDKMDPSVSIHENVNLSLLQVNKHFNKICSEIFYAQNDFVFNRAEICQWWVQHIGIKNFSRIRLLTLSLGSSFTPGRREERTAFDLSQEEVWLSVLCWMQNRHQLHCFHVQIKEWDDLRWTKNLTDEEKSQLSWCRRLIMSVLQRYRGVNKVKVSCENSRWLTSTEMQKLALLMQQRREDVCKPKELSLLELVHCLRLGREEEEEERRQCKQRYHHCGY